MLWRCSTPPWLNQPATTGSKKQLNAKKGDYPMTKFVSIAVLMMGVVLALILGGVAASVSARAESKAETVEVKIDNFTFGPATVTVPVGTTITWTNKDDIPHTVVSTDGAFKSKVLDTDEKFSFTFSKAGIYPYFCSIHPKMTAKIVVQ